MTVKHATASVFVFGHFPSEWRLGLITHPRLGHQMIPGGHVERDETQEQTALRVAEESGLIVRLVDPPALPLPAGYPYPQVAQPWWINEMSVPSDNHLAVPHVHIDHQYIAIADDPTTRSSAMHVFGWYREDDIAALPMFEDTRLLTTVLFSCIGEIAGGQVGLPAIEWPVARSTRYQPSGSTVIGF